MNAYASIGLGSAVSRGYKRTADMRTRTGLERVAGIVNKHRAWEDPGAHPADASAAAAIVRMRSSPGADRAGEDVREHRLRAGAPADGRRSRTGE